MDLLLACLTIFSVVALIAIGMLTYLNNPKSATSFDFLGICGSLSIWIVVNYLADRAILGLFSGRIAFASVTLGVFFFYRFTTAFPKEKNPPGWLKHTILLTTFMLVALEQTTYFIPSAFVSGGVSNIKTGPLYLLFPVYILAILGGSIFAFVKGMRQYDSSTRTRIKLVVTGIVLMALVGLVTNLLLPSIMGNDKFAGLGTLSTLFFASCTAYAIVRHKLFDIRFFAVRAIAYLTTLFVMIFALVLPAVLVFGHFLGYHPDKGQLFLVVLSSVCALYALQYIRTVFDSYTAKIFFRNYYDPQDVLDELSDVLVRTYDAAALRSRTAAVLKKALKPNQLEYVLLADELGSGADVAHMVASFKADEIPNIIDVQDMNEKNRRLTDILGIGSIALVVRLRTTHEELGYLVLGRKQSGALYNDRDKHLLSVAAEEIAISLQNTLRFEEIQHFNETLQGKVSQATKELRHSNHRLRELDSTKDDFISMASHQLRTPLTSVKGYLSMVLDGDAGPLNDTQKKLLEQSYRSSQQMVFLISDLLNLSRLNTGKFVIEQSDVDLSELVQFEIGQLAETAKARGLTLNYDKPTGFPHLRLDETKIHQVVMNFIDNAIYYTKEGGKVTVSLKDTPKYVEYRVTDTGIGVPKAAQHKLFSKFYRADNAQKARPDGTGLGLFMAKKVIAAQGGAILFESEEGKGSTFGFRFNKASHTAAAQPR